MAIKELKSIKFPGLEDTYVIPEGGSGTIDIDLEGSNEGEVNPVNADTLGGYPADEYVKKDELESIKPSLSIEKNYSVVGGIEEPSNPTENMIWVQTETEEIGKVYFSGIEPTNCDDNDIWISTSNYSSVVAFDSIRIGNDTMQTIYPISAKQYIGGAWVKKTAKSYQNGKWVSWWDGRLFNNGDQYIDITGGWVQAYYNHNSADTNVDAGTLTIGSTIYIKNNGANGGASNKSARTSKKIDLTNWSTLTFDGTVTGNNVYIIIAKETSGLPVAYSGLTTSKTLDISSYDGEYYVALIARNSSELSATEVYLS